MSEVAAVVAVAANSRGIGYQGQLVRLKRDGLWTFVFHRL